ncbi:MAG: hypothetical protein IT245_02820 [Bacteroidia bacterium]|nr:hypothetical protein [Bacteroidia bacterium]
MNMHISKIWIFVSMSLAIIACKKNEAKYQVVQVPSNGDNLNKDKSKSNIEFHSILSTNLFQKPSSINELTRLDRVIQSCGDKTLINEVIISNYMNSSAVRLPSRTMMIDSTERFVEETYVRFFIRRPTQAERTWFINFINANKSNPNFRPELVYTAFAASDEYMFY